MCESSERQEPISILNDVLGPVMRGPSSSHTAGPYRIGRLARSLLDDEPVSACFTFDAGGSFARVFRQQGSDLGFVAGLLGWEITDDRFSLALYHAAAQGVRVEFTVHSLPGADHPNVVRLELAGRNGRNLQVCAKSVGGGAVILTDYQGWQVHLTGDGYEVLLELEAAAAPPARRLLEPLRCLVRSQERGGRCLLHAHSLEPLDPALRYQLQALPGVLAYRSALPLFFVPSGRPLFDSAAGMVAWGTERGLTLGQVGLEYEATLLRLAPQAVLAEMRHRYSVMAAAVQRGLEEPDPGLRLLQPSAGSVQRAEAAGRLPVGGLHARAAARALAVMHVNAGGGVVCAAPTAGSAGVLPAVAVTLVEELGVDEEQAALALLAAGAVGLVVATRATFAAEVAGCQVEIGAAGAMAAAVVVEAAGGSARQATDAAAIALQNTMGSVCDLVQGLVEIPCHTRNAVAASAAFVCADLIVGGYVNPIPLDETVDAVLAVGKMLPRELRCTSLGGLGQSPSGLRLRVADSGPRTAAGKEE